MKKTVILLFLIFITASCEKLGSGTTYWKIASTMYESPDTGKCYLYKDLGLEMSNDPQWKLLWILNGFDYEEGHEYIVKMRWVNYKGKCTEFHYVSTYSKIEADTEVSPEDINLLLGDICY